MTRAFGVSSRAYTAPPGWAPSTSLESRLCSSTPASVPVASMQLRSSNAVTPGSVDGTHAAIGATIRLYHTTERLRLEPVCLAGLFRSSEDRKARKAGVDESRIPPGQYYTDKWPVLHAGSRPPAYLAHSALC